MADESRTGRCLRNGAYSASLLVVNIILGFVARGFFIRHVGVEFLGLNTSVEGILGLLNVAELGVSYAIASSLYGPMASGDKVAVAELVAIQGWVYRRVALFIVAASLALLPFFPVIFSDASFPLAYAYAAFAVYLFGSLLGFFVNYKMVVLDVSQEAYKVTLATRVPAAVRTVLQIIALAATDHGYEWWLALNVICAVCVSLSISRFVRVGHPYLTVSASEGGVLRHRYPQVARRVGQMMFHRIAGVALRQSSSVILLAYATLADVGVYGNYMLIFSGVSLLVESLFNGVQAGVGNLVHTSGRGHVLSVFAEILTFRVIVAAVCAFGFYVVSPSFVSIWVGPQYVMGSVPLLFLSIMIFIDVSRSAVDAFLCANGWFSDVWAALAEVMLNVGLSVLLGRYWGLAGILAGVLVSLVVIVLGWKPYFLFRMKMRCGFRSYWRSYACGVAAASVIAAALYVAYSGLCGGLPVSVSFAASVGVTLLFGVVCAFVLCVSSSGGRRLASRLRSLLSSRP